MKEFLMIFRAPDMGNYQPSEEEMAAAMKQWQDWIGNIAAQGKFVSTNQLGEEGKVIKADNSIVDGPFTEVKEMVGGYMIVKDETLDNAVELAKGCPIFEIGGQVEVRDIVEINLN
ncbi:YciI family protein [Ascidiimonas aurantiaca]|uniref:YciI family protein n=1 Tax=Ascidiimonas aurantiaca TaxID=1685432 RepID=UPI0030EE59B1